MLLQPFQGHSQLSTCSDHGIQTFPNVWAQPAPPRKAENQLWSGRNRHPAYGSQRELSACTHGWAAPTHPPTAAWEQHEPGSLPAFTAACPAPAVPTETHRGCAGPWLGGMGPALLPQRQAPPGMGNHPWPQCRDTTTKLLAQGTSRAGGRAVPGRQGVQQQATRIHQCYHPTSSAGRALPKGPSLSG